VNAHTQVPVRQTECFALSVHIGYALLYLKSCKTGVNRMASINFRQAAHTHVSVADRLKHFELVVLCNLVKCREVIIELSDKLLRLHTLSKLGKPLEVCE